jgi:electron transport complex protein RnfD
MSFLLSNAPHLRSSLTTQAVMRDVLVALIPAVLMAAAFFGWGVFTNLFLGILSATLFEAISLYLRKKPLKPFLLDGSAWVTGALLGFAIPQLSPWWLIVTGSFFAIVIAKQVYGGLGYNPFNPAAVGYVVLLICFPMQMGQWLTPASQDALSLMETLQVVFMGVPLPETTYDLITQASPLDFVKMQLKMGVSLPEILSDSAVWGGVFAGRGWEFVNLSVLAGGVYLIWRKVITWHTPVALLGTLALLSTVAHLISPETMLGPFDHLFSGGIMLAAFFIATDPVTAPASTTGRLIFASGAGLLIYLIRTFGGYPDGIAFAVLMMNATTPLIDKYVITKPYGLQKSSSREGI